MTTGDPIGRFAIWLGTTLSWLFAAAVLLTAYEVVMRYGLNSPTIWVHDLVIAFSAVCFVVGGAYALARDEHIRITTVSDLFPPRLRRVMWVVNALLTALFLAGLTWAAVIQASQSIALIETSGRAWDVPIPMVLKSVLAAGSALMLVLSLARLWSAIRGRAAS